MPSLIFLIESGKARSARARLRKAWPRTALLRGMRKVRLTSRSLLCTECRLHLLDITSRILRYSRIGEVKFIKDDAGLSKDQRIQLRNLSVPPGWVGMTNVGVLSQYPTIACHNHNQSTFHMTGYDRDVCVAGNLLLYTVHYHTLCVHPNYPGSGYTEAQTDR